MTRTENTTKNIYTGLINQFLILIFRFSTQTFFIKYLGREYLGINGTFSNILTILSLADLGIGTALVYNLYKPIADGDEKRQRIITHFLQKVYRIIGICILAMGILLMPFLKFIITEKVNYVNLYLVFSIYIFQTASTYLFFASKTEFLGANQKKYIYNQISNKVTICSNITQMLVLYIFRNFYIYLLTITFFNIFQAFLISRKTDKMYPFIKKKIKSEILTKKEKKDIFKDCGSLMLYRINYVVLTATDSSIITRYLGLAIAGVYANYNMIVVSVTNILATLFNSISAAIGNLHAENDKDKEYFVFNFINFITSVLFGIFAVGVYILINDFIYLWVGEKYVLTQGFALIISINLYMEGIRKFLSTYRSSYGLFRQAKFMPIFGMVVNLVVSIILVQKIGIIGVLLGTLISNLVSCLWYDPYMIYKYVFKKNVFIYYLKNILYLLIFALAAICSYWIKSLIVINGILGFLINGIITVSITGIVILVIFYKTEYVQYIKKLIINILKGKLGKNNG